MFMADWSRNRLLILFIIMIVLVQGCAWLLLAGIAGTSGLVMCVGCKYCCWCQEGDRDSDGECRNEDKPCSGDGCAGCNDGYRCEQVTDMTSRCKKASQMEICHNQKDDDCRFSPKISDYASEAFGFAQEGGYDKHGQISGCDDDGDGFIDCNFVIDSSYTLECDKDDQRADVKPGAIELCDNIDHDQDGAANSYNGNPITQDCASEPGKIQICLAPNFNPKTDSFWSECYAP